MHFHPHVEPLDEDSVALTDVGVRTMRVHQSCPRRQDEGQITDCVHSWTSFGGWGNNDVGVVIFGSVPIHDDTAYSVILRFALLPFKPGTNN
jgi:hypothetical protein